MGRCPPGVRHGDATSLNGQESARFLTCVWPKFRTGQFPDRSRPWTICDAPPSPARLPPRTPPRARTRAVPPEPRPSRLGSMSTIDGAPALRLSELLGVLSFGAALGMGQPT